MQNRYNYAVLLFCIFLAIACKKEESTKAFQNAVIKKTIGPNLVGEKILFSYAMGTTNGKLSSAQVIASIAGADGTGFEPYSWNTSASGGEVAVVVAENCVTNDATSSASFIDTAAATLRYFYVVPEEARGKSVSFTFSGKSSNGENVNYTTDSYPVSNIDMVRNIEVEDNAACYLSIRDMKAYSKAEVDADAGLAASIDLIYLYREKAGVSFAHALVSPAANAYLEGAEVPSGSSNDTKIEKQVNIRDQHLSGKQYAVFVDDIDFKNLNLANAADFVLNFKTDEGAWVETNDGKYRAFIYINAADNSTKSMTISMKRLTVN